MPLTPVDMMARALQALGDAPAESIVAFLSDRYGVTLDPRFVPVLKASLAERRLQEAFRRKMEPSAAPPASAPIRPALRAPLESLRSALALPAGGRRLSAVRRVALDLLTGHGLSDWAFAFNRRKRTLGLCRHRGKTIELSVHLVERNGPEEVLDTLLHEIAHALVGARHGHDTIWKRKCVEVGAAPERCGDAAMPAGRWRALCPLCGRRYDRCRRPKRLSGWYCPPCGPERGALRWQAG